MLPSLSSLPAPLRELHLLGRNPAQTAARPSPNGRPLLGLVCPNLPAELPHALGFAPRRLVVRPAAPVRSAEVLQTFCCTWVQALLDQAMAGELSHLTGVTFSCNSCDSLQNLPDIWGRTVRSPAKESLFSLRLPVQGDDQPAAMALLVAELHQWQQWLEQLGRCQLRPGALQESAALYDGIRASLRRLQRAAQQGRIGASSLQAGALVAQLTDAEQAAELLERAAAAAEALAAASTPGGTRLVLVGGYQDDPRLLNWLEQHDAQVVADETCTLSRMFEPEADLGLGDPLEQMARRHLRRTPCPVQLGSARRRAEIVIERVRQSQANGVVLLPFKGCEPHAFDNVIVARSLEQEQIPFVGLEQEPHAGNWGQLTTRLGAFLEMFSALDDDLYDDPTGTPDRSGGAR